MATIRRWAPDPSEILEVGCGEGAMTERLRRAYPGAPITAIDVTPRLGRLFRGSRAGVEFVQAPVEQIASSRPQTFDLVILSDVLHHVRPAARASLLEGVAGALAPGGTFAFKEWVRDRSAIHWACEASDRYLTGDDVDYLSEAKVKALLAAHFGADALGEEQRIRPWRNNMALRVRPTPI
jgi:2-polyprenyl-6-hydroxyphenyl methylase/3-demethylubiquinone-9 3-methyltransferase